MAIFDERPIRSPSQPAETIRTDDLSPWMVWAAAAGIGSLALFGLYLGVRGGHPAAGIDLTLTRGEALNPATAAAASPAIALPNNQPWSTLNGPEVLPKSAVAPKSAAADESDSGAEASEEPVAAAAATDQAEPAPAAVPPPAQALEPPANTTTP